MSSVRVKENEPFDVALRRFKRLIEKTGLLNDLRAREFYEKPTGRTAARAETDTQAGIQAGRNCPQLQHWPKGPSTSEPHCAHCQSAWKG